MPALPVDPLPRVTTHLVLRRLRLGDLVDFQAYRSDPNVGLYQGWLPMSTDEANAFIREMSIATVGRVDEWMQLGIADRVTDRLIGDIGICVRGGASPHCEIGYSLSADWQGQGLATEAVSTALMLLLDCTEIDRVVAVTDAKNGASMRLLERVGMTLASTEDAVFRGEPCTEHMFVVHRSEVVANRRH